MSHYHFKTYKFIYSKKERGTMSHYQILNFKTYKSSIYFFFKKR